MFTFLPPRPISKQVQVHEQMQKQIQNAPSLLPLSEAQGIPASCQAQEMLSARGNANKQEWGGIGPGVMDTQEITELSITKHRAH